MARVKIEDLKPEARNLDEKEMKKLFGGCFSTASSDAQTANVDLQNALQNQQQTLQMTSSISKLVGDTEMAVIRKIGG